MSDLFLKILNMSITASWIVLAVVVLRFLLKKAPKWIMGILWGMVALRLIFPFSIESLFSIIPSSETIPQNIVTGPSFQINSGIEFLNNTVNENVLINYYEGITVPVGYGKSIVDIISFIWVIGIIIMLIYAFISYFRIKKLVQEAVNLENNIYSCDHISTPFILGVFYPKIYLPSRMSEEDAKYVIMHEKAHIKRFDFIWKPLGFSLLAFYWFNPVLWIAYILLCRDIEFACDERVIKELGSEIKKPYSDALINCSMPRKFITVCPLAFGEVGVKKRIKSVLNYKKPTFWIIIVALISCVVAAVCLLTNPKNNTLKNIERHNLNNVVENTAVAYYKSGNNHYQLFAIEENLLNMLFDIEISKKPVSKSRSEERDSTNSLLLDDQPPTSSLEHHGLSINFSEDFSEVWIYDGVKPTYSYTVKSPEYAKQLFNDIVKYGTIGTTENIKLEDLKNRYPEYFGLSTAKGLEVYIWQMAVNNYNCALLPKSNRKYTFEELLKLKGTSMEEMRMILSTYNLYETGVDIVPFCNPISSYSYTIDDNYREQLEKRFWTISVSNDTFSYLFESVKNALNKRGIEFDEVYGEPTESGKLGFFNDTERMYTLRLKKSDFDAITFHKFKNENAAQNAKNSISPDGSSITVENNDNDATTLISWVSSPHWYIYGDTLILYVGDKNDILNIIEEMCGKSFAGINPAPSVNISNFNVEEMKIHYNYVGWHENAFSRVFEKASKHKYLSLSSIRHFPVVEIDSKDKLNEFIEFTEDLFIFNKGYNEYEAFLPTANKFDNQFFKEKSLLIIYADSGTGQTKFTVKEISGLNDELFIHLDNNTPEVHTADMAGWFITIEVYKETLTDYNYFIAK